MNMYSCLKCRSEVSTDHMVDIAVWRGTNRRKETPWCPVCYEKKTALDAAAMQREIEATRRTREIKRAKEWESICPAEFATIDRALLPNPALLDRGMNWNPCGSGLLFHSETGRGKTRVCWEVSKKWFLLGMSFRALDSMELANYSTLLLRDGGEADRLVKELCRSDLVLWDDIFKTRLTDARESMLFSVLDYRTSHRLPLLITTNDWGSKLLARFSEDRGEPFVRRLREFCEDVKA